MGSDPLKDEWDAEKRRHAFRTRGQTGKRIAAALSFIVGSVAISAAIFFFLGADTLEARAAIAVVWIVFVLGLGGVWRRIGR